MVSDEKKGRAKLESAYYDTSRPSAYSSIDAVAVEARSGRKKAREYVTAQETWARHKPVVRKFRRLATTSAGRFQHVQMDLCDVRALSRANKGHHFLLTLVDTYSRYAFVRPVHRKTGANVRVALESICEQASAFPSFIICDRGREFYNSTVREWLRENFVQMGSPTTVMKASQVERYNRTLQGRIYRYLTANSTKRYIDVLDRIVDGINRTKCRAIGGLTPHDVFEKGVEPPEPPVPPRQRAPRFALGDRVLIVLDPQVFRRGYHSGWSGEIFTISDVRLKTNPVTYRLIDDDGDDVIGFFYEQELSRVYR